MASLKDLIVNGVARIVGKVYSSGGFVGNLTGNCSGSSGSCTGNSASATKDASGNIITTTYATKNEIPSVQNNLTSTSTTAALSAAQGKVLDDKITNIRPKVSIGRPTTIVAGDIWIE